METFHFFYNWTIPSTTYNEPHENFLNFCIDNFLTQIIETPTHKKENILDVIICNHLGSDRIISHSVLPPLTDICDHNLISFSIIIGKKNKIPNPKITSYNFKKEDFKNINKYL